MTQPIYTEGGSFQRYTDPNGKTLISVNRDGSLSFADGTSQNSGIGTIQLIVPGARCLTLGSQPLQILPAIPNVVYFPLGYPLFRLIAGSSPFDIGSVNGAALIYGNTIAPGELYFTNVGNGSGFLDNNVNSIQSQTPGTVFSNTDSIIGQGIYLETEDASQVPADFVSGNSSLQLIFVYRAAFVG